MSVLHLIDESSAQACPTTLALLGDAMGRLGTTQQHVGLLGGQRLAAEAAAAGLDATSVVSRVGVPLGRAMRGWFAVRRRLAAWGEAKIIHAWSLGTLTLATLWRRQTPRLLTVTTPLSEREVHWLRMLVQHGPGRTEVLTISATLRRELISGGVPQSRVHVLRPGIDLGRVASARRTELRRSWGIAAGEAKGRETVVVALLTDPPQACDSMHSTLAVGLAGEAYDPHRPEPARRLYALMHPEQQQRVGAVRMMSDLGDPTRLRLDDRLATPWTVLPGCDLALATGPNAGGLAMLWAMAANVPIVAEATYAVSEIVEDRHSALLAKPGQPKLLAHRLIQLIDDPRQAYALRDTARHECYSFFSRQRYCTNLNTVYDQVASGRAIDIPAMDITGGLRFTGRA